jgi:subtilisin family serine protease
MSFFSPNNLISKDKPDNIKKTNKIYYNDTGSIIRNRSVEDSQYIPGQVIIKFRQSVNKIDIHNKTDKISVNISSIDEKIRKWNVFGVKKLFPEMKPSLNPEIPDLSGIYQFDFSVKQDVMEVVKDLTNDPAVEYAEPRYIYFVDLSVNDPQYIQQRHLTQIKAESAWNLSQGDKNVIISIVDTGIDWDHEDLNDNIWINSGEDINGNGIIEPSDFNGLDDDGNGYIDDIRGWDFVNVPLNWSDDSQPADGEDGRDADNDPTDFDGHGTHCAGVASAVTNNGKGVASIGFNCSLMPVRVGYQYRDGNAGIAWGNEGIKYAVDNGADVISLSWGGGGYSQAGQDIINYAFAKGVVITAAAGNDDSQESHYPSAYDNVVSAAYTIQDIDRKASDSNYGPTVDICAPGTSILSTIPDNQYTRFSGSSMASPLVAGVAGLIKSLNPHWDNEHIAIQLMETADNIDDLNPDFRGLLGGGRLNAYRALTENPSSVQIVDFFIDDSVKGNNDGVVDIAEIIDVVITLKSFLDNVTSVSGTLSTDDPYITILNNSINYGNIAKGNSSANENNPFSFISDFSTPAGHRVTFRLDITANNGNYTTVKYINLYIQPLFSDHNINNVTFTISSFGLYGYNDYAESEDYLGHGFQYPTGNSNALYVGSLWVGTSANQVSDCSYGNNSYDNYDWITLPGGVLKFDRNKNSDQDGIAVFNDSRSGNPIGLEVTQRSYAWAEPPDNDYVVLEFTIQNKSGKLVDNVYIGLYMDWDIEADLLNLNSVGYDSNNRLGYMYGPLSYFYGISMLYPEPTAYRAIDHDLFVYNNQLIDRNKYDFMKNGFNVVESNYPFDWSHVLSTGPFSIENEGRKTVAFAVLGGDNINDIKSNAASALKKYDKMIPANIRIEHTPLADTENISKPYDVEADLFAESDPVNSDSIFVFWKNGGEQDFHIDKMNLSGDNTYKGQITQQKDTHVLYYIIAKDINGRSSFLPYGAPDSLFSFYAGIDNVSPIISEITVIDNTLNNSGVYKVDAMISDNMRIDTNNVLLHFKLNDENEDSVLMKMNGSQSKFLGEINFNKQLSKGDSVSYFISARDLAVNPNQSVSEIFGFVVVNYMLIDNFESDIDQWDLGYGWSTNFFARSGSNSITDSPAGFYEPNAENRLTLLPSFDLSSRTTAAIEYYYIHSLAQGDSCFFEMSTDGQKWQRLTSYNGESGYQWQREAISLRSCCGGIQGEHVQLRFSLMSNSDNEVSDGFYLDDMSIYADTFVTFVEYRPPESLPKEYKLRQNYPNPFNPETTIAYNLPKSGYVKIEIYSLLGEKILTLVNKKHKAGRYIKKWNGKNALGIPVTSGIYFYKIIADSYVNVKKMILLK